MNISYHVINSDPKKPNKAAAQELMDKLAGNWAIVSEVGTGKAVHYILVEQEVIHAELSDEDAQIIRDNLDTTHGGKHE